MGPAHELWVRRVLVAIRHVPVMIRVLVAVRHVPVMIRVLAAIRHVPDLESRRWVRVQALGIGLACPVS